MKYLIAIVVVCVYFVAWCLCRAAKTEYPDFDDVKPWKYRE